MDAVKVGQVDFGEHAPTGVTIGVEAGVVFLLPLWRLIWGTSEGNPQEGKWQPMLPGTEPAEYGRAPLPAWLRAAIDMEFPDKGKPPNWSDLIVIPAGEPIDQLIAILQEANRIALAREERIGIR